MARRPFLLTAVTLIGSWACDTLGPEREGGALTFEVREVDWFSPPDTTRQIELFLATEEQYPCANYRLESDLGIQGNKLRVDISGRVTIGQTCLTAIGPAQFRAVLPLADGAYALELARGGLTDRYILTVTEAAIDIATLSAQFTRPTAQRFPRGG